MTVIEIPARHENDPKFQWDLTKIYPDSAAWEADFAAVSAQTAEADSFRGHLAEGPKILLACLQWQESVGVRLGKLYCYASLLHDEDQTAVIGQALYERCQNLAVAFSTATAFFAPEVLSLPEETLTAWLALPTFALYARLFEDILRMRPHVLSQKEEELLAGTSEMAGAFSDIYEMLAYAELPMPLVQNEEAKEERLSAGNYVRLLRCRDRAVREGAYKAMYDSYTAFGNTFATCFSASVKKDNFSAKSARFPSALAASLFGDNIAESVYQNLIATVRAHRADMERYLEKRRSLLGLPQLAMWDLYVPLFPAPKASYSWQEAKRIVRTALSPLGEDYCQTLASGLDTGWVDVYENKGKRTGAYSSGAYGTAPYILLNHQDDLESVFTLAHEGGHSMHTYYSHQSQPYLYADYRIFVAEVASTVNENLLSDYLLREAKEKETRRYLINHYLEEFRATVIRQTMFAEFELAVHQAAEQGQPLNADFFCETYLALNQDYFGSAVTVDPRIAWEWARIPHFYRAYYVYKYATGFCAASALSLGLLDADPAKAAAAQQRYHAFLRAGSSKDPLDLLADAGVDMRTTEPLERAFRLFAARVDELE